MPYRWTLGGQVIRPVDAEYLALELPPFDRATHKVVMEVRRCQPMGPFYEIGGRFA